jgi:hypothetical protein
MGLIARRRKEPPVKFSISFLPAAAVMVAAGCSMNNSGIAPSGPTMGFFVSSAKSKTGNLGGLSGADQICQDLAAAAGVGNKTWRAYLSAEQDPANNNRPTDARSRIGNGPWFNAHGITVAKNLAELHARKGDVKIFVDERGQPVPGNWPGSPRPNEHDILTGSTPEGTVMAGKTCNSWTSEASNMAAQVGHADGIGRGGDTSGASSSWNSSHESGSCADTAPRGGAGRIYCFAR